MATPTPLDLTAAVFQLNEAVGRLDERTKYLGDQIGRLDGSLQEHLGCLGSTITDLRQDMKEQVGRLDSTVTSLRTEIQTQVGGLNSVIGELRGDIKALHTSTSQKFVEAQKGREQISSGIKELGEKLSQESQANREDLTSVINEFKLALKEIELSFKGHTKEIEALRGDLSRYSQESQANQENFTSAINEFKLAQKENQLSFAGTIGIYNERLERHTEEIKALRGDLSRYSIAFLITVIIALAAIYLPTLKP